MINKSKGAQQYFDRVPKEWDALYSHENRFMYWINRIFRKGLYQRYQLTFENCGNITGARVLDIGCGTGRYSIEFAKRGAAQVVGFDFAPAMVAFSQNMAREVGVADICSFICADFLTYDFEEPFDIVVALGFFDYIREPEPFFQKISSLTKRCFLASFPGDSLLWGTQRKIRYHLIKKCPLYFYSLDQLKNLYLRSRFTNHNIIPSGSGFFGIGNN